MQQLFGRFQRWIIERHCAQVISSIISLCAKSHVYKDIGQMRRLLGYKTPQKSNGSMLPQKGALIHYEI